MPSFVDSPDFVQFDLNHLLLKKTKSQRNDTYDWTCPPPLRGVSANATQTPGAAHWVTVEGLEVEVLIGDADVAGVADQGQDDLHGTLHVGLLSHALKA